MSAVSRRWLGRCLVGLVAALGLAWAAPAAAQRDVGERAPSRFSASFGVLNTQPLGELETGPGYGVALSGAWAVDAARRLRLRGELRAAIYGRDTRTVCLSETVGCLIEVDINTDYTTVYFGVGPEVAVPLFGSEVVLDATAGVASFGVTSSLRGVSDPEGENLLTTNHFSDTFFAWSAGGELRVPVSSVISLALGARYQHNGEASYVREGGVTRNPDGSIDIDAITTGANQMALTLGVVFHPYAGWGEDGDDG